MRTILFWYVFIPLVLEFSTVLMARQKYKNIQLVLDKRNARADLIQGEIAKRSEAAIKKENERDADKDKDKNK